MIFITIANKAYAVNGSSTTVTFDIRFADNSLYGEKIVGAALDLFYDASNVTAASITSPTFLTDSDSSYNVWGNIYSNLYGSSAPGKIALTANGVSDSSGALLAENPITGASGLVLSVSLTVSGTYSSTTPFDVTVQGEGGVNYITVADGTEYRVDGGVLPSNDHAPVLSVDHAIVTLPENTAAGVIADADADATDEDGNTITFSLVDVPTDGSGNALFSINSSSGQISLTDAGHTALNYESLGRAFDFDGYDDEVVVADRASLDLSSTFTLEAWILPQQGCGVSDWDGIIFNKEDSYEIARFHDGSIKYALLSDAWGATWEWIDTGLDAPLDAWSHVAFIKDGTTVTVLLTTANGTTSTYTGTAPLTLNSTSYPLTIGGRVGDDNNFSGVIDEARVWNIALTADELTAARFTSVTGTETGLVGAWHFEETSTSGSVTTTPDASTAGTSGTLVGFSSTTPTLDSAPIQNYLLTLKANDGDSSHDQTTTIAIIVSDVDEFNVAFNAPADSDTATNTIAENAMSSQAVGITASASDPDGTTNIVTYSLVADGTGTAYTAGEFTIDPSCGVIKTGSTALNFEVGATRTLYVKATSADGSTAIQSFTVQVTDVNEAPTAITLSASTIQENVTVGEGGVLIGTLSVTDPDASGNSNTLSLEGTDASSFTITDGKLYYTGSSPDREAQASYAVRVKSSDGQLVYSENFTITVTDVNEAPGGMDKTVILNEDSVYTFSSMDFGFNDGTDGDGLAAVKISSLPAAGELRYSGTAITAQQISNGYEVAAADIGNLTFVPVSNASGTTYASFTFQVRDNGGTSTTGDVDLDPVANTITFDVTPENDAPALDAASYTPVLSGIDEDPASNSGTTVAALVADGSITDADGTAVESIYVTAVDVSHGVWQFSADSGGTWQEISFSGSNDGKWLLLSSSYLVKFVPAADWNGSAEITFGAWDASTGTAGTYISSVTPGGTTAFSATTDTASITVTAGVDIDGDTLYVDEDTTGGVTTNLLANDSFEGTATITDVTQGSHGTVEIVSATAGTVKYTPSANFNGTDSYTYTVTSGGVTEHATVTVTVNQQNDAATFGGDTSQTGNEDAVAITGTLTVEDTADGIATPNFRIETGDGASHGTATINETSGAWSYTPIADWNGSDSFRVSVTDDDGNVETQVVSVTVSPVADIEAAEVSVDEDSSVTSILLGGGTFENTATITAVTQGTHGTVKIVDATAGRVMYTPGANFNGTDSYTYTVTSGGVTETATVTVTVSQKNDTATFGGNTTGTGLEDALAITGTLSVEDTADGIATPNFRIETGDGASHGTATINATTGAWSYIPTANWNGNDSFRVSVTDADGNVETQVISVSVTPVSDAPSGTDNTVTFNEDATYTFSAGDFGFTDTLDSDEFAAVKISTLPTSGTLHYNGAAITNEQIHAGYTVAVGDLGKLTFVPAANANGTGYASFTFQVQDDGSTANSGVVIDQTSNTITFNVTALNDPPVNTVPDADSGVEGNQLTTSEDTAIVFRTVNSNAITVSDAIDTAEGATDFLTTTVWVSKGSGTLLVTATGHGATLSETGAAAQLQISGTAAQINLALEGLTYTPTSEWSGTSTLSIATSDGTATDTDTISITVNAVNDAPVAESMVANVGPNSQQTFDKFHPIYTDAEGDAAVAIKLLSAPSQGTFEHLVGDSWVTVTGGDTASAAISESNPLTILMADLPSYRYNANGLMDGSMTTVDWAVVTKEASTATEQTSNIATGYITIVSNESNASPVVTLSSSSGSIVEDHATTAITMTVRDDYTPEQFLPFSFSSNNERLITESGVAVQRSLEQTFTVTLGAAASGLSASDFTVSGATVTSVTATDNTHYTVVVSSVSGVGSNPAVTVTGQTTVSVEQTDSAAKFQLVFTPNVDAYGSATLTVGTYDGETDASGQLLYSTETYTLTVTPDNETPLAFDFQQTIGEDGSFTFSGINPATIYSDTHDANANTDSAIVHWPLQEGETLQQAIDANLIPSLFVIDSLPTHGTLTLSGVTIVISGEGQNNSIAVTDLANLFYTPTGDYSGTDSFTWHAVDADPDATGSETALSTVTRTATFTVTAVNDAPVATAATLAAVLEDTASPDGATVSTLFSSHFSDAKDGADADVFAGIAVVGYTATAVGAWQYSSDGSSWMTVGTVSASSALTLGLADKLRFLPAADQNGEAPTLTVRLIESPTTVTSGAASVDVSSAGGSTTISLDTTLSTSVTAVNDVPVLDMVSGATVTDTAADDTYTAATGSLTGTLTATDADGTTPTFELAGSSTTPAGAELTEGYNVQNSTPYGTFYLNTTSGVYKFVLNDAAVEALKATETLNFTVNATDGTADSTTQTITIALNGTNDTPVLATVSSATVTDTAADDTFNDVTGTLTGSDRDDGAVTFELADSSSTSESGFNVAKTTTYGTFYLNTTSGAYKFVVNDAAVEALTNSTTVDFTVNATDGTADSTTQTITITLNGANDTPVLATVTSATVTDTAADDTFNDVTGTLSGSDRDNDTVSFELAESSSTSESGFNVAKTTTYGTFYLNTTSGAYKFVVNDAAVEGLEASTSVSFTVNASDSIADSTAQTITITLAGANDAPSLSSPVVLSLYDTAAYDTFPAQTGTITATDRDLSSSRTIGLWNGSTVSQTQVGTYGSLSITTSGAYTYTPNAAVINQLTTGTHTDTFTVRVTDENGTSTDQLFTVNVTGTNDTPVITCGGGGGMGEIDATSFTIESASTGLLYGNPYGVAGADIDNDGLNDIVAAFHVSQNKLPILWNDGDGTFTPSSLTMSSQSALWVETVDLNHDGYLELIVPDYAASTVTVYMNNGQTGSGREFAAGVTYSVGSTPFQVDMADVNGDTHLDMISADYSGRSVSVWLGIGDGTFSNKATYAAPSNVISVASADVDHDGDADIIASLYSLHKLAVLLNDGQGSFSSFATSTTYSVGSYPWTICSADLNNDGWADVVSADSSSSKVSVLINNGDTAGIFNTAVSYTTYSSDAPIRVSVADLDGDGYQDILVSTYSGVQFLINKRDGTFNAAIELAGSYTYTYPIDASDIDGDGDPDILTVNSSRDVMIIYNGLESIARFTEGSSPVTLCSEMEIADPDGDAEWNGGTMTVRITANATLADKLVLPTSDPGNDGIWINGTNLQSGSTVIGTVSALSYDSAAAGDGWTFTFDDSATNALVQAVGRAVQFYNASDRPSELERTVTFTVTDKNGGEIGTASTTRDVAVTAVNDAPVLVDAAPAMTAIDEDVTHLTNSGTTVATLVADASITDVDLASGVPESIYVTAVDSTNGYWQYMLDSGSWTTFSTPSSGYGLLLSSADSIRFVPRENWYGTASITFGAWDETSGSAGQTVSVSSTGGSTAFSTFTDTATVSVGSINDAPVITCGGGAGSLTTTSFTTSAYTVGTSPYGVTSADVNGDGDLDLIAASYASSTVSVLLGNGDGTFEGKTDFSVSNTAFFVTSADVDKDNDVDLITTDLLNNTVSVLLNDGFGSFGSLAWYAVGAYPFSMVSADVNGDGWVDLITANANGGSLSVLLNDKDGTFTKTATDLTVGTNPYGVTSADVNGDGDLDLIASNYGSSTVSVLLGNGDGTFVAKADYAAGSGAFRVASADVDGDGDVDLITTNFSAATVSVLLNNGAGSFGSPTSYAVGNTPYSVTSADMDGDGDMDILVANMSSNTVSLLVNDGQGSFAAALDYTVGNSPSFVTAADVDGNGGMDILVANQSSSSVSVLLNSLTPILSYTEQETAKVLCSQLEVSDVDGDADWTGGTMTVRITANATSDDQLVLPTSNPGSNGIWIDGTNLQSGSTVIGTVSALSYDSAAAGDGWTFTFDDSATNALVQAVGRAVQFYNASNAPEESTRTVTFTVTDKYSGTASTTRDVVVTSVNDAPTSSSDTVSVLEDVPTALALTDFGTYSDLDGGSTASGIKITTLESLGSLEYSANGTIWSAVTLNQVITASDITAGHLRYTGAGNGYGDSYATIGFAVSDGIAWSASTYTLTVNVTEVNDTPLIRCAAVATSLSEASFAEKVDYAAASYPLGVVSGDVDNDGDLDLITTDLLNDSVSVLLNYGNGTFAPKVDYAVGDAPFMVRVGDVDGLRGLDLIVVNNDANTVSVLLNDGDGTFTLTNSYQTATSPQSVVLANVDGQNGLDLIVGNYNSDSVSVLLNNGNGTFAAKVDYTTGSTPSTVTAANLNGDAYVDLIVGNYNSDSVSVLLNNGDGTFATKVDYTTGDGAVAVSSADLDGDGDADMAVANKLDGTVSVLLNSGSGTFTVLEAYSVGAQPVSIDIADINGDGDLDLVVATRAIDAVSVLLNNGDGTFSARLDYAVGDLPQSVTTADVDGDGDKDIIAANSIDGDISVLFNNARSLTTFTEQQSSAVTLCSGMEITDPDGNADWDGGTMTVRITANATSDDQLVLPTSYPNTENADIWINGTNLQSGSTVIGTVTTDYNYSAATAGDGWMFTFNSSATDTLVRDVARAVQFRNVSGDDPSTLQRTVTFSVEDKDDASATVTQQVAVLEFNDAPTTSSVTLSSIVEESGAHTITSEMLLVNAGDPEGDTMRVSNLAMSTGSKGTLEDNGNGTWTYTTAAADYSGVEFTYTITDSGTSSLQPDPKSIAGTATMDITPANRYDLTVNAVHWNGEVLPGVGFTGETGTTDANGQYVFNDLTEGQHSYTPTRTVTSDDAREITVADAIMVLKQAVGLISFNQYQQTAADFNRSGGSPSVADAIDILEFIVDLEAPDPVWVFSGVDVNLETDQSVDLVGVLTGDVNGTWG